jgi:serine/threonine protein kinase
MHIMHRDITPSNVMVSWGDAVKLTDFGLSKRFGTAEMLQSCVGTLMYSCPELATGIFYTEKADIWAAGCLLYQMATLQPPFVCSNALALVKRIVGGDYPALPATTSPILRAAVAACLRVQPEDRPDILGLCAIISDPIMVALDGLQDRILRNERQQTSMHGRSRIGRSINLAGSIGSQASGSHRTLSPRRDIGLGRWPSGSSMREDVDDASPETSVVDERILAVDDQDDLAGARLQRSISNSARSVPPTPLLPVPPTSRPPSRSLSRAAATPSRPRANSAGTRVRRLLTTSLLLTRSGRLGSAATAVSIPPHRLRPIEDPNQAILTLLHQVVAISQRPPQRMRTSQRAVVDAFKRALFSGPASDVKPELRKILQGAHSHHTSFNHFPVGLL